MTVIRAWAVAALITLGPLCAIADDAPPPPMDEWLGKGQFGFLQSKGNTDAQSLNGNIDLSRYDGDWKNEVYAGGLYGKNSGVLSAERWEAREQTNYNVTHALFAFGGLRFEHDLFDGFVYQGSVTGGLGYKFIDTQNNQLTVQAGPGYRRLRPELINKDPDGVVESRIPQEAIGEVIATVGVDYLHKFTPTTTLTNKFLLESGADNTLVHDEIALAVKMSPKLALSVGYSFSDNTKPPGSLKKVDTTATVNLAFAF